MKTGIVTAVLAAAFQFEGSRGVPVGDHVVALGNPAPLSTDANVLADDDDDEHGSTFESTPTAVQDPAPSPLPWWESIPVDTIFGILIVDEKGKVYVYEGPIPVVQRPDFADIAQVISQSMVIQLSDYGEKSWVVPGWSNWVRDDESGMLGRYMATLRDGRFFERAMPYGMDAAVNMNENDTTLKLPARFWWELRRDSVFEIPVVTMSGIVRIYQGVIPLELRDMFDMVATMIGEYMQPDVTAMHGEHWVYTAWPDLVKGNTDGMVRRYVEFVEGAGGLLDKDPRDFYEGDGNQVLNVKVVE